jgi:hypothetical protein
MFSNCIENTAVLSEGLRCLKLNTRGLLLLDWQRFWRMKVTSFSMLISSRCIKWHCITLPKNKIFISHPMINGNMVCNVRCVHDRIHSIERSTDRRNAMVYRHNSSDNIWRSLLLFFLTHFLSIYHAVLCRPTRAVKKYILHGRVAHRNHFPRCQFELPVRCGNDEEQTSLKWERISYPVVTLAIFLTISVWNNSVAIKEH